MDHMPYEDNAKRENTSRYLCPSCGGGMDFDPETQSLQCPYCQNKIEIAKQEGDIQEYDFETAEDTAPTNWGSEKRVIHCESCGAETVLDENSTAQFCAFCGSSHIINNNESPGIVPESLIPFKITREKAMQSFKQWIKKRFFSPGALKNEYQNQRLSGMYIPCWTYDSDTYSTYTAEAGTYYYETVTDWVEENGQRKMVTRQVRRTSWRYVSGTYTEFFDDVLINASDQVDEGIMKSLEPFHLNELVHYQPQFLSGFLAQRYSVGLKEGWEKAQSIIKGRIKWGIERKINADEIRNLFVNTAFGGIKYKHILLPVWISAYTYKGKVYRYMVNGQTGEVQGKAPLSPVKIIFTIIAAIAVIAAIAFLMSKVRQ